MNPEFDALPDAAHVDVKTVATLYGCAVSTIWARLRRGQIPTPKHFGGSTRWNIGELKAALSISQSISK